MKSLFVRRGGGTFIDTDALMAWLNRPDASSDRIRNVLRELRRWQELRATAQNQPPRERWNALCEAMDVQHGIDKKLMRLARDEREKKTPDRMALEAADAILTLAQRGMLMRVWLCEQCNSRWFFRRRPSVDRFCGPQCQQKALRAKPERKKMAREYARKYYKDNLSAAARTRRTTGRRKR